MTTVIGLTGGIGSGKSTVSRCLAELGAIVIDADKVGHDMLKPDTEVWREVVATFGQQIVAPNGKIDREKLGEIVFDDPAALSRLNQIMHPRMYEEIKSRIADCRRKEADVVVLEAALLIETSWTSLVDKVWVTVASKETVLKRLEHQRNLNKQQVLSRIRSQMTNEERAKRADVIINNEGQIDETIGQIKKLWAELQA